MPNFYEDRISSLDPEIWFKFDEASGTPANSGDSTAAAISFTNGAPTANQTSDVSNTSYDFDGTDDGYKLDTGALTSNTFANGTFSIEAWVNTSSTSGIQEIFQMGVSTNSNATFDAGWALRLNVGKPEGYYIGKTGTTFTQITHASSIANGNWHHLVLTVSTSSGNYDLKLYVDGALSVSDLANSTTTPGSNADGVAYARKRIGYSLNDNEYFDGKIDELAIYTQALTAAQVEDNYESPPVNVTFNSDTLTASALSPDPTISTSKTITFNSDPLTASADIVSPTLSLDTDLNTFGVATASADSVTPTIQVEQENNYSADPATASALFTDAAITTTRFVSVSASPATASALLGGNVYAGPTVQDTTYDVTIRKILETSNQEGKNGFSIGSQYTGSTLDARTSVAFKPVSGIPTQGSLIKVQFDPVNVTFVTISENLGNAYNVYVFTEDPSTSFITMTYANLPAKELLYATRANDSSGQRLDLTQAFRDSRAASYGIFVEHIGEPPYSGTVYDRTEYNGSNLNHNLFLVLTSDFVSINFNAPVATASATQTDASIDAQKYVDVSESPATASADIVNPVVSVEIYVNPTALVTTATAEAVQPSFLADTIQASGTLNAHSDIVNPALAVTGTVFINVDPLTTSATAVMPEAQIGEEHFVAPQTASALFVMPLLVINKTSTADAMIATALSPNATTNTGLIAIVNAEPMTAQTFLAEPPAYFDYTKDKWLKAMHDFQIGQFGFPNVPLIKFFTMSSNILSNSIAPGNTSFVDRIGINAAVPQGTFVFDRQYASQVSQQEKYIAWSSGYSGSLKVGSFDNQNRKAVQFDNIRFDWRGTYQLSTGTLSNPTVWTIETMIKTSKQNQVLFSAGPLTTGGNSNRVFNMGLYNGKFFATHAVGNPGNEAQLYRAFPWDTAFGVNYTGELVKHTTAGRQNIADGQWHHVVIQMINGRLQVFIDAELDFQRYGITNLYPRSIGYADVSADANANFYVSAMSISPDVFLSDRQIDLHNSFAKGFAVYEAEPATATAAMPQNIIGRGNKPRALALYWWPNRLAASGAIDRQEDLWDSQSGDKLSEFDYQTFFKADTYQPKSQQFFGWDIYAVDVTGNYYSEIVDIDSYPGGVRTTSQLIGRGPGQKQVTISDRGFRDPITDNRRYIDLINDIDLDQVEAIFFLNYPNESQEKDEYTESQFVDDFFNIKESAIYQDFLTSLRAAVDRGINLMVSNAELALDLGIVDRVEIVDPLIDGINWVPGGYQGVQAVGEPNNDFLRSATLVPGAPVASNLREGKWYDFSYNNRLRIVNTIPGITDLMFFTLEDKAFFEVNGQFNFGKPPELYTKLIYRPNGAAVGTEFIMPDASDVGNPASNDYVRRYFGVPFENVKAGTIVAAFGQNYKRENTTVANPYANYATHIALERGTVLQGRPIGGRIWVTLTERPQLSTNAYNEVEMGSDFWIDLAFSLNLITTVERDAFKADINNIDRKLESGDVSQEYYNKYTYWSELGFNQSTSVSGGLRSVADQAVAAIGKLFDAIFTQAQAQGSDEASVSRFFSYGGIGLTAMIQNFYLFKKVPMPTVSLNGAAFGWIANKEIVPGTQVRDIAGTASALLVQPIVVADKIASVNAQAAVASATQVDPTNYVWTQKDVNVVSLPMLATAMINPKLTIVRPEAMTATALLPQNITSLVSEIDQIVLYINHTDPVLYLREDIVK